jgi:CheY-like chemotaxis protein
LTEKRRAARVALRASIERAYDIAMIPRSTVTGTAGVTPPRRRVLVVDNEPSISVVVHRILGEEYELCDAVDAQDAIALISIVPRFDAILCDLLMPRLSGQGLYQHLLTKDAPLARRIVFITGAASLPDVQSFLSSVSNVVLQKPFTRAALYGAVQSVSAGK